MPTIFLARHATPDFTVKDLPYDIHPGPPLSPLGEAQAAALADFLRAEGVNKVYYSPFDRAARTAQIIAVRNHIVAMEDSRLAEWREVAEVNTSVQERMLHIFNELVTESLVVGSIALVSHGGPVALLLQGLGIDPAVLAPYRQRFDTTNPLPPAGAWSATWNAPEKHWDLELVFTPPTDKKP